MRIAVVTTAICLSLTGLSAAYDVAAAIKLPTNIPAQELRSALQLLTRERDIQLVYRSEVVRDLRTQGASGELTALEALGQILSGTGLTYRYLDDKTVTIIANPRSSVSPVSEPGKTPPQAASEDASARNVNQNARPDKSPWSRARLAQLDQGAAATAAAVNGAAQSSPASSDGSVRLEEVVVTARKRAENLQDVPVAVHIISGQSLSQQNENTLADLTQTVPGVHVSTGDYTNSIYIRGIGSNDNPAFEQSVATFIDDIYSGRSRLTGATFLDLDRIEILKGPQSTFFGNNAIAGALNIVTKKPGDTLDGFARLLYGMYGQYAAEGALTLPLGDTLSARLAVTRTGESGWITNQVTGQKAPDENNEAGRLTLLYKPTEALEATLKIEGSRNRTSGTAFDAPYQYNYCPPPAPLTVNSVYRECSTALAQGVPIGLHNNQVASLGGQFNNLSTFASVLTLNYQKWRHTFTSVTGYTSYDSLVDLDAANVRTWLNTSQLPEHAHQISQEFRVASPTDGPFEYLAGLYYQSNPLDSALQTNAPFLNPLLNIIAPALQPYLPWAFRDSFVQDEEVYSAFGSLSWNVTQRLKLNAGLRGSWVHKSFAGQLQYGTATQTYGGFARFPDALESSAALLGPAGARATSVENNAWMPSAGLQYRLNPEVMAYASYSRGFKAGGFNAIDPTNNDHNPGNGAYGPEYVNAYEAGIKSKWLDDRLLVNVDVFLSDYKDLQVTSDIYQPLTNTYVSTVRNAAQSRSQGVELEMKWALTRALTLGANVGYLDAHYVSYPSAAPTALQQQNGLLVQDLSGSPTDFAPKWSGSLMASYSVPLGNYRLLTEVTPYFSSSFFTSSGTDDSLDLVGGYVRLDARLSLSAVGQHWTLDLIGKNLANRIIPIIEYQGFAEKEAPRNVAIQFRYAL